jgi:oligopeptide/dipeptide ABC transporter ATP-binding protein
MTYPSDPLVDAEPAPPAEPDELLRVEHLTAGFPAGGRLVRAVQDVSFTLTTGETLAIVGESGSGKSATALSLLRLLRWPGRVLGGQVRFRGRDLLSLTERELRVVRGAEIGFVFQEPMSALSPVVTAGDHIAETLVVHGRAGWREARRRAVRLLEMVQVPDAERRARDYPHQLSGGLRQRVMIAAALACRPALLVADEPTAALDVTIQAAILDLLRQLRDDLGMALLLITHDVGVAAEMADRVAVMYAGSLVEQGDVRTIFAGPRHPYTQGLLACALNGPAAPAPGPSAGARLRAIEGTVPRLDELPDGCAFGPRCPVRLDVCATAPPPHAIVPHEEASGTPPHEVRCHRHASTGS